MSNLRSSNLSTFTATSEISKVNRLIYDIGEFLKKQRGVESFEFDWPGPGPVYLSIETRGLIFKRILLWRIRKRFSSTKLALVVRINGVEVWV